MTSIAHPGNNPYNFGGWDVTNSVETRAETADSAPSVAASPPATTDQECLSSLVARMAQRDQKALAALYDATASRVYGLALRITRSSAGAEDVSAEVFHQSWRSAEQFNSQRGTVITWLLTMTRSRAIDQLRRRDQAESHAQPEQLAEVDTDDDPQQLLIASESNSLLNTAIAALIPVQRQMIALAFYRGLSHQEIADHCKLPLGTVKTHVRKAIEHLRAALVQS